MPLENLEQIFEAFEVGSPTEIKEARKTVKKLWNKDTKIFDKNIELVFQIIKDFDLIADDRHKAAVISGLSLAYLSLTDDHFEDLKNFIVKNLQNTNGQIREVAVDVSNWLYVSLSERALPFVFPEGKLLTEKQKTEQVVATKQYADFVFELEVLMDKYPTPNENTEYIDDMKPSINKSLQKVWSRLTDGRCYPKILERTRPIPIDIFMKRKEIERELVEMLEETESDFDLEDIKEVIYDEEDHDDLVRIIAMFDNGQGLIEMENILDAINDAWNYFPHKILDGLSPAEKILEFQPNREK
jgi:hypothetical protein